MEVVKLLNKNYQKYTSQYEVDEYIRQLRSAVKELKLQNDFLSKTEPYLPINSPVNYPYKNEKIEHTEIEVPDRDFIAITITFDQKFFPQLFITPLNDQIKYIEKVFSTLIYEKHITAVYGSFERQKNGFIHGHFIVPHYGNYRDLEDHIASYFTNRKREQHAVLIKPVTSIINWFIYINKSEDFKEFIEYNLKIKSLNDI